jgi:hypothetical protein
MYNFRRNNNLVIEAVILLAFARAVCLFNFSQAPRYS